MHQDTIGCAYRGLDGAARAGHSRAAVRGQLLLLEKGQETNVAPPPCATVAPPRPRSAPPFAHPPGAVAVTRRGRASPPPEAALDLLRLIREATKGE